MATDLTSFNFTRRSDLARDLNDGLFNNSNVNTLQGNDTVEGAGTNIGILNDGRIDTSTGNDSVEGRGKDSNGILNNGRIDTGRIDLGRGSDTINGFGDRTVVGGDGFDTAVFEFDSSAVTFGSGANNSTEVTYDNITMTFFEVEEFVFADDTFDAV